MVNVKSPQKLVDVLKPTKSSPGSPSPKGSPRSPRIRTEQQRESQVLIENFFREQNITGINLLFKIQQKLLENV